MLVLAVTLSTTNAFRTFGVAPRTCISTRLSMINVMPSLSLFSSSNTRDRDLLKLQILQLGAALDRGQAYNPTSGPYYEDRMAVARQKIESLIQLKPNNNKPTLASIDGEWELIISTVPNGIFRSSPFFLAIQTAFALGGQPEKAALFFKLHELQTCSWGVSKVGRVAQFIDAKNGILLSEFDTSIFALTAIPFLGYGKLIPTFGGCVQTFSSVTLNGEDLDMEVMVKPMNIATHSTYECMY